MIIVHIAERFLCRAGADQQDQHPAKNSFTLPHHMALEVIFREAKLIRKKQLCRKGFVIELKRKKIQFSHETIDLNTLQRGVYVAWPGHGTNAIPRSVDRAGCGH
ncbi:MAG: hypothetical protein KDC32_23875, partial [Saprospiraceae bacterium]|nr:hypothetical protein [Saprospiraceae bacterium]